jgi:micrococcal nuclease
MMTLAIVLQFFLLTYPARAHMDVGVIRVIDGDTFEAEVHKWPHEIWVGKIRLAGIDAPEIFSPECKLERILGVSALKRLTELLDEGRVFIDQVRPDAFGGRVVAKVYNRAGEDVAKMLLAEKLAAPYGKAYNWCNE